MRVTLAAGLGLLTQQNAVQTPAPALCKVAAATMVDRLRSTTSTSSPSGADSYRLKTETSAAHQHGQRRCRPPGGELSPAAGVSSQLPLTRGERASRQQGSDPARHFPSDLAGLRSAERSARPR